MATKMNVKYRKNDSIVLENDPCPIPFKSIVLLFLATETPPKKDCRLILSQKKLLKIPRKAIK
jgi:hypothetical protein